MVEIWILSVWNGTIPVMQLFAGWSEEEAKHWLLVNEQNNEDNEFQMPMTISKLFEIPEDSFLAKAKELIDGV